MGMRKYTSLAILDAEIAPAGATASSMMRIGHRHTFDYTVRPGFLYVRSRAISSRTNDNFDTWPAGELKKAWHTFIGKPVFVNHHNDNHKRARGVIIDAALHEDQNPDGTDDTWVEVLMEVDAVRFPKLAAAIINGDIERTSMGADVTESECSVCGNRASTPTQYCAHVARMKGQKVRRRNTVTGAIEDVLCHEICLGISFFENSLLVEEPADPTAVTWGVDTRGLRMASKDDHGNTDKGNTTDRGYGWDHQKKREELLKGDPKCHWCKKNKATEADHYNNGLVPSCSGCNNDRSHEQQKKASQGNFGFDSQKGQFPASGPAGVDYFKGDNGDGTHVDCLLWRSGQGELRGVLYHYPFDFPPYERKGNVNILVDPAFQRQGIATDLLREAMKKWPIDLDSQSYTDEGQKFIDRWSGQKPTGRREPKYKEIDPRLLGGGLHGTPHRAEIAFTLPGIPKTAQRSEMTEYRSQRQNIRGTLTSMQTTASDNPFQDAVNVGLVGGGSYMKPNAMLPAWTYEVLIPNSPAGNISSGIFTTDRGEAYRWATALLEKWPNGYQSRKNGDYAAEAEEVTALMSSITKGASRKTAIAVGDRFIWNFQSDRANEVVKAWGWGSPPSCVVIGDLGDGMYRINVDGGEVGVVTDGKYLHKMAYGETIAPAQVDTLRQMECPVCLTEDSWDGSGRCRMCGYFPPPEPFRDPDLALAKEVDLHDGVNPALLAAPPFIPPEPEEEPEDLSGSSGPDGLNRPDISTFSSMVSPVNVDLTRTKVQKHEGASMSNTATQARQLAHIATLRRLADAENPAQPVPQSGSEAVAVETTGSDGNATVTDPGATSITDVAADGTTDVTTPGASTVTDTASAGNATVTTPTSGFQINPADMVTRPDVNSSAETLGADHPAYTDTKTWTAAMQAAATARVFASIRLARLQIQAGIAGDVRDDIQLGIQIEASRVSNDSIRAQIQTLQAVASARPAQSQPSRIATRAPSLAGNPQPNLGFPVQSALDSDEFAFEG